MENTIIIDKIMINYIDFEKGELACSNDFVNFEDGSLLDYYHKKIEKTLCNENLKRIDNVDNDVLNLINSAAIEQNRFDFYANEITEKLASLGNYASDMPNTSVMFTKFKLNGEPYFGIIKLNFKDMPKMITQTNENKRAISLTNKQQFNTSLSKADEAIFYKLDTKEVYLIEKKFKIDEKSSFYLNEFWLRGKKGFSDKEKLDRLLKTLNDANNIYGMFKEPPVLLLRKYIGELEEDDVEEFNVYKALISVLEDGMEVSESEEEEIVEETKTIFESNGLSDKDTIIYYKDQSATRLKTKDDVEIKAYNELYLDKERFEIIRNEDDTYNIIVKNVSGYVFI